MLYLLLCFKTYIYKYSDIYIYIFKGSLEVKLPAIWTDGKAEVGRAREEKRRRKKKKERSENRKSQRTEDAGARKGRKVAKDCVFQMICGSGGSTSRLAKAAGAEPSGQMRDEKLHAIAKHTILEARLEVERMKKCTPLWCEAPFEVKSVKI